MNVDGLGPFDSVLDVGGNVGDFAEQARGLWPDARITSFEPIPELVELQKQRARGRWWVEPVAITNTRGKAVLHLCENQHSASTMQQPGTTRGLEFGLRDQFRRLLVDVAPLDDFLEHVDGRLLVKVDVEGHEQQVIEGARGVLERAACVIVEVQQDPHIFLGAPSPLQIDHALRVHGLRFAGVASSFAAPSGRVLQFDGIWLRA